MDTHKKSNRWMVALTLVGMLGVGGLLLATMWKSDDWITPVDTVIVRVRHKRFPNFDAKYELRKGRPIPLHDTAYWMELENFACDFSIDPETRKAITRSNEMKNPGARVGLWHGENKVYGQWIFMDTEPVHEIKEPGFVLTIAEVQREGGQND